jgi:glycosyltransferase involved in cell wall biosynthesis
MTAPRVSCVMVTRGRPAWVAQAIRYFEAQAWPADDRELVIIYDDEADLPPIADRADVRRVRVGSGRSIGEKRNLGARDARGAVIVHWDDDDYHGPDRVQRQVAPLFEGTADVTGLFDALFFEPAAWTFWRASPALHAKMFVEDVHGGTLAYRRAVWDQLAHYPRTNLREDADFLVAAMRRGARLARVPANASYVYLRHGRNTWRLRPGELIDPAGWRTVDEPAWLGDARAFYRALDDAPAPAAPGGPRVSCIMPTCDREPFVPRAVRQFLDQRGPDAELIIVDDGARAVDDLVPADDRIRYLRLAARRSIGHKRNLACEAATGDIIVHWDDDDWMAPTWIATQVAALAASGADVTGLSQPYFHHAARRRAYRYAYPRGARPWVHGGTLCYTRALWRRNPFPDVSHGEDLRFQWSDVAKTIVAHDRTGEYIAGLHDHNTSARPRPGTRWCPCPVEVIERLRVRAELFAERV